MTAQAELARRFRELHQAPEPLILPNPGDRGTARLLEQAGFEALATSSAGLAFTLGLEDGAVPRPKMLRHIAEIARATALPVSADLGDGFGRAPERVADTIRRAAEAGAVGGSIEDCSTGEGAPLLPLSLATERVAAAVEAAEALPFPFLVTARAETFMTAAPDLDDALARLAAYRAAGAHVLYAPGLREEEAIAKLVAVAAGRPVNVLAQGSGIASSIARLAALGVKRISLGSALTRLGLTAILEAIRQLRHGGLEFVGGAVPMTRMNDFFSNRGEGASADD
jgi:2-methylisocitrate lyase-like PEP mutase family enzyme